MYSTRSNVPICQNNRLQQRPLRFSAALVPDVFFPFVFPIGILKKVVKVLRHEPNQSAMR